MSTPTSNLPFKNTNICNINVFDEVRRITKDEFYSKTIVKWNENFIDTIECRFQFTDTWRKLIEVTINNRPYIIPDGTKANFRIIWDGKNKRIFKL